MLEFMTRAVVKYHVTKSTAEKSLTNLLKFKTISDAYDEMDNHIIEVIDLAGEPFHQATDNAFK